MFLLTAFTCKGSTEFGECVGYSNKEKKNPKAVYEVSIRNAVWTILGFEMAIPVVLYFLYYVECPVKLKKDK